ncbi:hypothetical protein M378DRAFT_163939 [Amanita muscaria Koide BX008]|uniref:Uncharacterized protein n=1 Tax=Amanita muscaria (strain Koide BX008) TaxID=946122 RepID=A0A0C2SLB7_AMAMK|nr:hypothetical protein M378DRAFT_163939 [Amanita muscaria Koide BX008]
MPRLEHTKRPLDKVPATAPPPSMALLTLRTLILNRCYSSNWFKVWDDGRHCHVSSFCSTQLTIFSLHSAAYRPTPLLQLIAEPV